MIKKLTNFAATLVAVSKAQSYAREFRPDEEFPDLRKIDYELFGFCLGLYPEVIGEEGPFVQSDMQFVQ